MPFRWGEAAEGEENVPQPDHRGERLPGGSQSLFQRGHLANINEEVNASAKQPVGEVEKGERRTWLMENLMETARTGCASDLCMPDVILGATADT